MYDADGSLTYDAAADLLSVSATPLYLALETTGAPMQPPTQIAISMYIADSGGLIGGVPGDDFLLTGTVDIDADGDSVAEHYAGDLLKGEIQAYGYQNGGPTDIFDFVFTTTGGALANLYGSTFGVQLTSSNSAFDADFTVNFSGGAKGNVCKVEAQVAAIGDFVWEDTDADGIQGAGEPGIEDVTVNLYRCDDTFVATMQTDADGKYLFDNLAPGDYYVEFVAPDGYVFSPEDEGADDTVDSDPLDSEGDGVGQTICTTLDAGETDLTWDAGLYQLAAIGDFVWEDTDADGIQDAGESGIAGVTVNLYDCEGTLIGTTTTDADGKYLFAGLTPGDYYVEFVVPSGYTITLRDQGSDDAVDSDAEPSTGKTVCTTLDSGETDLTWDAGLHQPPPKIDLELEKECRVEYDVCDDGVCPKTPGYWKNHPDDWPVSCLVIGGRRYTQRELMNLLNDRTPSGRKASSDMSVKLAKFVVATKLSLAAGADPCNIGGVVGDSDAFLKRYRPGCDPDGYARKRAESLKDKLDAYLNGGCDQRSTKCDCWPPPPCPPPPPPPPPCGCIITWTITLVNKGPDDATGVEVTDALPDGLTVVSVEASKGAYSEGTSIWTVGDLDAGETAILKIVTKPDGSGGTYTNTAEVTAADQEDVDSTPNNHVEDEDDQDSATCTCQPPKPDIDLELGKECRVEYDVCDDGVCPKTPGYWKNHPDDWPVSCLVIGGRRYTQRELMNLLNDRTPSGRKASSDMSVKLAKFVVATKLSLAAGADPCNIGGVVGDSDAFLKRYRPGCDPDGYARKRAESLKDKLDAYLNGGCDQRSTKCDCWPPPPCPPPPPPPPPCGCIITWTITLVNKGPDDATGVEVTDALPDGLTVVSVEASKGAYSEGTSIWTVGDLDAGETAILKIVTKPDGSGGTYTNTAEVTAADQEDVDSTPNNHIEEEDDQDSATCSCPVGEAAIDIEKFVRGGTSTDSCLCTDFGKPKVLKMGYTGDGPDATSHSQDSGKVSVDGDPNDEPTVCIVATDKSNPNDTKAKIWFDGTVNLDETLDIDATNAGKTRLAANTYVFIYDLSGNLLQSVKFHTSCSQPLFLDNQFGSLKLVGFLSENDTGASLGQGSADFGQDADDPTGPELTVGSEVVFTYVATNTGDVQLTDIRLTDDMYSPSPLLDGGFNVGDTDKDNRLDVDETWLYTATALAEEGQHKNIGTVVGTPVDESGDVLGPDVSDTDPAHYFAQLPSVNLCTTYGKPRVLRMEYTGDGDDATSNSQDDGKVVVTGDPNDGDPVRIVATDKSNPNDEKAKIWFDGTVSLDETFDIDATNAGKTRLASNTYVFIYDMAGPLLQTVKFHTSCSQPLFIGDQFGSLNLVDFLSENGTGP